MFKLSIKNGVIFFVTFVVLKHSALMKKIALFILCLIFLQNLSGQIKYSTAWFGPNANPVPEFTDARIPSKTTISLMGDYYFGFGDKTKNGYFKFEIPLLAERVSLKVWSSILESYNVTNTISLEREMKNGNTSGKAAGDFYVQTRISILKEQKYAPDIVLNSTLKTASANNNDDRRYFDTPGYYFDLEVGKSLYTKSRFISEIRAVIDMGFMCWETTNSTQNDAPMYAAKIIVGNKKWKLENTLSGYYGWMNNNAQISPLGDYGDAPLVYATKFSIITDHLNYFAQYQYGIKDFPYHQIRVGISFPVEVLTPKYK